jgi:hypothetical protein
VGIEASKALKSRKAFEVRRCVSANAVEPDANDTNNHNDETPGEQGMGTEPSTTTRNTQSYHHNDRPPGEQSMGAEPSTTP